MKLCCKISCSLGRLSTQIQGSFPSEPCSSQTDAGGPHFQSCKGVGTSSTHSVNRLSCSVLHSNLLIGLDIEGLYKAFKARDLRLDTPFSFRLDYFQGFNNPAQDVLLRLILHFEYCYCHCWCIQVSVLSSNSIHSPVSGKFCLATAQIKYC